MGKRKKPMECLTPDQSRMAELIDHYLTSQYVITLRVAGVLSHRRVWGLSLTALRAGLRVHGVKRTQTIDYAGLGFVVTKGTTLRGTRATVVTRNEPVMSPREEKARLRVLRRAER